MLRFAIERGVIVSVFIAILCMFGIVAMTRVPVQMTPDIEPRVISVQTQWPGATPLEIETEILIEQEEYLRNLEGLIRMTSTTNGQGGAATIDLEFTSDTNIQEALVQVNSAISQVSSYPENVDPPRLIASSSTQNSFIFLGVEQLDPDRYTRAQLSSILDKHVLTRLERIAGVSQVSIFGSYDQQVHINVDPEKLAARQITIAELRQAIRNRNRDISGGDIESGKRRYLIRTVGRYKNIDEIANTIVRENGGFMIRVKDVADVSLQAEEQRVKSYLDGRAALMMGVQRTAGSNVVDILDNTLAEINHLNQGILQSYGIQIRRYADDVRYVKEAIGVVQKNLILGGFLACVVLYLFLHSFAPTLIGAMGVPICAIGAFLGLLIMDRTLNVISLAGVAFAIGMTLDNSIVVLENIFRHRAMGKKGFEAALDGVSEVWTAVLASTLTTVFVFAPIVLIEEEVGQLYSDIAIAMSAAIIMSMLIAVTAMPSILARIHSPDLEAEPQNPMLAPFIRLAGAFKHHVLQFTSHLLDSVSWRLAMVVGVLALCLLILLTLVPRAEYLPEGEESKIFTFAIPPTGYNLNQVEEIGARYNQFLMPHQNADGTDFEAGRTPVPPLKVVLNYNMIGRMFGISEPLDPDNADALNKSITEELRKIPGLIVFSNRGSLFSDSRGGSRNIQLDIAGADLPGIYQVALNSFLRLQEVFPNANVRPDPGLNLSQPSLEIDPDWQRAAELGMTAGDLGYAIWALSDGAYVDDYFLDDEKIDIYLYGSHGRVTSPDDINQLAIYTPKGGIVPLSALARVRETVSADSLRRVDARRTVTLNIVPPHDIPLEEAVERVQTDIIDALTASGEIPDGVSLQIGGASDKLHKAQQALSGNLIIALALSYLLMVAIFAHWGYPLIILLAIPLGISGGIVGLWLMNHLFGINTPLDMITMLGMVVLIGTVVNNPILLVEQTRRQIAQGKPIRDAVHDSIRIRLRPIMMSMLTTIVGLSPVVFLPGAGTELYRGLGAIVLFGLMFSTILTLTFIPSLLSLVLEFVERVKARKAGNITPS
jgi:multidrug efflux pump subunit AcrB